MSDPQLARRAFLASAGKTLASAGVLAFLSPARVVAGGAQDAKVFEGQDVFDRLVTQARERRWSELPIGERIGAVGMALRRTPYVASTLELYDDREVCSVDFRGLDCVTFFELALAFARMLRRGERTPDALLAEVAFLRYRGGQPTDYASRLHYLSDWFADNQTKGVARLITQELPGAERADAQRHHGGPSPGGVVALRGAIGATDRGSRSPPRRGAGRVADAAARSRADADGPPPAGPPRGGRGRENRREARSATRPTCRRGSQNPLHHDDVDPLAVQPALLAVHPDLGESEPPVEADARHVEGERGQHQLVIAELAAARDERRQQPMADTAPAPVAADVDRQVRDMVVGRAR